MRYDKYDFTIKEWVFYVGIWAAVSALFAYFFYRSKVAFFFVFVLLPLFLKAVRKSLIKKRKWKLTMQFADALLGISTALQAGNSVENAFRKVYEEMAALHGADADITKEFYVIVKGIENNMTVEMLLEDFAKRCEVEEIEDFSDIFTVGKRTGGNLREMMTTCCNTITEKLELRREFRVLIASKKFEMNIMSAVPFGILIYIGSTSRGFFDCLYQTLPGRGIMTGCFIVYVLAYFWGMKIIEKNENR